VHLFIDAAVTAGSLVLFFYWFRYGCLLILSAETAHDYTEEVARANHLSFPTVQSMLRSEEEARDLDKLHQSLERDFTIISYLLRHTPVAGWQSPFEDDMLKIQHRVMSAGFRLTRSGLEKLALDALEEMALVVAHLANQLGERNPAFYSVSAPRSPR